MASDGDWKQELNQLIETLRDPFRMRMAVAAVAIAVMFLAISDPIQGRLSKCRRELRELEATVQTAQEVLLLRDRCQAVQDRIIKGKGNDVVVSHLIDIFRSGQVELSRIDTQAPEKLGPLQTIRATIDVAGSFDQLIDLLHRLETDQYLIRVESATITPPGRDHSASSMRLDLRVIKEQP